MESKDLASKAAPSVFDADAFFSMKPGIVPVTTPGYPFPIFIREISAGERDVWERRYAGTKVKEKSHLRASLVALCAVDSDGNRLFTDAEIPALAKRPSALISPIFDAACEHNHLLKDDIDAMDAEAGN